MAVGTQSEANMGVVSLKDAKVGGTISNYTNGRNFTNMSLGVQSEANLGVVKVENAKVSGSIPQRIRGSEIIFLKVYRL